MPGDADGLAFSVSNPAAKTPDSLKNIFTELADDVGVLQYRRATAWKVGRAKASCFSTPR